MADIRDKRIATLTETASQTPQFQPDANPVQSGLNALGMGLQFIEKQRAEEQLATLQAEAQQREQSLAQGVLGLRKLRQGLASQGASSVKIQKAEEKYLAQFSDPMLQMEVVGATNKLTKGSLSQSISEAQAVETARMDKLNTASQLSGFSTYSLPENPTESDVDKFILNAQARQSQLQAIQTQLAVEMAGVTTAEAKRKIEVRGFGDTVRTVVGAGASRLITDSLQSTNLSDPAARKEMMNGLLAEKATLRQRVQQFAEIRGVNLSSQESAELVASLESGIDSTLDFLSGDAVVKMNKNTATELIQGVLFESMASTDPATAQSATSIMLSIEAGLPVQQRDVAALRVDAFKSLANGELWKQRNVDTGEYLYGESVKAIPYMFKGAEVSASQKAYNSDMVKNNFTGSSEKLNDPMQKKVMAKTVEGIANGDVDATLPVEDKPELADLLKRVMEPKLVATISRFVTEKPSIAQGPSAMRSLNAPTFVAQGGDRYSFNPDTLEVRPTDPGAAMSPRAAQWNKLVKDTVKAYEKLDVPASEIEVFKDRVRNTMGFNNGKSEE